MGVRGKVLSALDLGGVLSSRFSVLSQNPWRYRCVTRTDLSLYCNLVSQACNSISQGSGKSVSTILTCGAKIERGPVEKFNDGMTRSGYMVRAALGEGKRAVRGKSRGARAG
jgi:hypothetical protein